jgi:hypothetical protein
MDQGPAEERKIGSCMTSQRKRDGDRKDRNPRTQRCEREDARTVLAPLYDPVVHRGGDQERKREHEQRQAHADRRRQSVELLLKNAIELEARKEPGSRGSEAGSRRGRS